MIAEQDTNLNYKIAWIESDSVARESITSLLFANQICKFKQSDMSLLLFRSDICIWILSSEIIDSIPQNLMDQFRSKFENAPLILQVKGISSLDLSYYISTWGAYKIFSNDQKNLILDELIKSGIEEFKNRQRKSNLNKELFQKNKYLEKLTEDLEKLISERTFHIQDSNKEQSDKLTKERSLLRFIKDFSFFERLDEGLFNLRREVRKFHKISDPYLVFQLSENKTVMYSYYNDHFSLTKFNGQFPFPNNEKDSSYGQSFANHFGRPFGKLIHFPLQLNLLSRAFGFESQALLVFELYAIDSHIDQLTEFMIERSHALSMSFDRLLLENLLSNYALTWEKTFESVKDPFAIVSNDYNIIRSNKKFSKKYINKKCYQVFAFRDQPCEKCPLKETLNKSDRTEVELEIDGRFYMVQSHPIFFKGSDKNTHVIHQYIDITDEKYLYLKMLQSEKMGAVGILAGNIAHELNNPLTGIRSLSQVLQSEISDQSTLFNDLKEIEKATERSQTIIKNLLEFAENKNTGIVSITVDEIVNKTLPMLKTLLRYHRAKIDLKSSEYVIEVEPHLIQQVVFNLVNNACQAMGKDGEIEISTFIKDMFVVLKVKDNGPGIPEHFKSKIFDAFFTTKKEGLGTGLGLSISKSIIERFNGSISFTTDAQKGTEFLILLPIKKELK